MDSKQAFWRQVALAGSLVIALILLVGLFPALAFGKTTSPNSAPTIGPTSAQGLRGYVYAPDGTTPANGAWIGLEGPEEFPDRYSDFETWTNANGWFSINVPFTGTYWVMLDPPANHPDWMAPTPMTVTIQSGQYLSMTFQFSSTAQTSGKKTIHVKVQKSDGSPVTDAEVYATGIDDPSVASGMVNASGEVNLEVAPGTWDVWVEPMDWSTDWEYTGFPKTVSFEDNGMAETKSITFTVGAAESRIIGRLLPPGCAPGTLGTLAYQVLMEAYSETGEGNVAEPDGSGYFTITVPAGTYYLYLWTDMPLVLPAGTWGPYSVDGDLDLGDICLETRGALISGRITHNGVGVPNVSVAAWEEEGMGFAFASTDAGGYYTLTVSAGLWEVEPWLPSDAPYQLMPSHQTVRVPDNSSHMTDVDFQAMGADARLLGRVVDQNGNLATDFYGWAYAQEPGKDEWMAPLSDGPVDRGRFNIAVAANPGDSVYVGLYLPPEAEFSVTPYTQTVTFSAGAGMTQTVIFTLTRDTRSIYGTFTANGAPIASPLEGEVYGFNPDTGAFRSAPIEFKNGQNVYTLTVSSGDWFLNYIIWEGPYANVGDYADTPVTVGNQDVQRDFDLMPTNATLTGQVLSPSGAPISHTTAYAFNAAEGLWFYEDTDGSGRFTMTLPANVYQVGAGVPPDQAGAWIEPPMQTVTVTVSGQTPDPLTLQFRQASVKIQGQVLSGTMPFTDTLTYVWGWEENGGGSDAYVDESGSFTLTVAPNSIWHVGAMWTDDQGNLWESDEVTVTVGNTDVTGVNLTLKSANVAVPQQMAVTFDADKPFKVVLDDGTEIDIPAKAVTDTGKVTLYITPKARDLNRSGDAVTTDFKYALNATVAGTNRGLNGPFRSNVIIKFRYDPNQLPPGLTEDDIRPAYYSSVSGAWIAPAGYTVDKTNRVVTMQINHFTDFALTGVVQPQAAKYEIYLPIVTRNYP